ncbi:MAG: peptidase, imelysin family protein [Proteobacteria bacterium]|nr:MAG: peptidase, imelysin family protein [Pseudomonadota bacterium]
MLLKNPLSGASPRRRPFLTLVVAGLALALASGCDDDSDGDGDHSDLGKLQQVLDTNADIAYAAYSDSVTTAKALQTAIAALIADPTEANLSAAKDAWLVAREPYGQTEVYRFRASPIDDTNYDLSDGEDGPEGDINAWPLGEALIDYVVTGNDFGADQLSVTAHSTPLTGDIPPNNLIAATDITIDAALLANTVTAEDERDVLTGYHAIEFLLWGQDLNADGTADTAGVRDQGQDTGGHRPATDYAQDATCTSGPTANGDAELCTRRATYLQLVTDKLVADLESVRDGWAPGASYRTAFTDVTTIGQANRKLLEILTGMGTLSEGELAGERMQIALSADSQEDEHSCFSDNTHRDILLNALGVLNTYRGVYAGYDSDLDGEVDVTTNAVNGYGIDSYLSDVGFGTLASEVQAALDATATQYDAIDAAARAGKPVDVLIMNAMSDDAAPMRQCIKALNAQSFKIAQIAIDLGVGTADDVVDPGASECDTTDPTSEC